MTSVFLSYSHVDEPRVRLIKRALEARGHDVFWDEDIPTGDDWRKVLEERVRRAQCVLVAWSPTSVKSRYVLVECKLAAASGRLFPARIEKVDVPSLFDDRQTADLSEWIGNVKNPEWRRLLTHIEQSGTTTSMSGPADGSRFRLDPHPAGPIQEPKSEPPAKKPKRCDLQEIVEDEIRTALDLSPVEDDAFRDITTIRARGDASFADQLRKLERQGYEVVESEPGQALLERRRRFNWVVAVVLTLVFILPVLVYVAAYFFLPRSQRIYVVQVE